MCDDSESSGQASVGDTDESTDLSIDRPQAPKRRTRVKTGCATCRIRRVKCDEQRPACQRCTSTGRKCDGYPSLPMSRRDLPVAVHDRKSLLMSCRQVTGVMGFADTTEMLYFEFFRSKTSPRTNQFLGSEFWQTLVLQLSHQEPAVKHAVLAISALHQSWNMNGTGSHRVDGNAMVQHGKAMIDARKLLTQALPGMQARKADIEKVLVVCILFVCFENLIGDYQQAATHLFHGLQILDAEGMALSARGLHHKVEPEFVELLNRFDFQALTFSQTQFPMRKPAKRFSEVPPTPLPTHFESLTEVRIYLFEYISWVIAVDEVLIMSRLGYRVNSMKEPSEMLAEATIEHAKVQATLVTLWNLVEELVERRYLPSDPNFRTSTNYLYLLTYYRVITMVVKSGYTNLETSWDPCIPEMAITIKELAMMHEQTKPADGNEKSSLSLEVGICVPLFVIGNKCRDPVLRRRVVDILDSDQRLEGIWESRAAARVVERSILVEEGKARQIRATATGEDPASIEILCAADIPEEARVQIVSTVVNMSKRTVHLTYSFHEGDWLGGEWSSMVEKVEF